PEPRAERHRPGVANRGKNELLRLTLPLEGLDANEVAKDIEPLLGSQGKVVPQTVSNSLVITDVGKNLRMIVGMLQDVTTPGDPEQQQFKRFALKNVAAQDAETTVGELFGVQTGPMNVGEQYEQYRRLFSSRERDGRDSRSAIPLPSAPTVQLAADVRTNSLLVKALPSQMVIIEEVVKSIDVPEDPSVAAIARRQSGPYLLAYKLDDAEADEVANTINAIYPNDPVINEDDRNELIHVFATEEQHREIAALVRQMDTGTGGLQSVAVLPLARSLDPLTVATTVQSLFLSDGENAPAVMPDVYNRQLMVRGSADQIAQIRTLLTQWTGEGSGIGGQFGGGRVRTLSLGGRDPQEFLPLLERVWEASSENPI
ncbi:MAG: secretin N-terminal domain-containing protein, partial [Planctomycetaceae bacterium]